MRQRSPLHLSVYALAAALLVGCGTSGSHGNSSAVSSRVIGATPAPSANAGLQTLIDGARKEGQLTLVWGEGTLGGSAGIGKMADLFNKAYGLNLQVSFTPGPSQSEMGVKIAQEYQANKSSTTDLFSTDASTMVPDVQAGALASVEWEPWATNVKSLEQIVPHGLGVAVQSVVVGITYNTDKVKGDLVPQSFADLLKPQYKGRLASTPYAAQFDRLAAPQIWGTQRTLDYATQLSGQLAGLIRCGEIQRLTSGEFDVLAPDCSQGPTMAAKAKGVPLDYVVPNDAAMMFYYVVAVPKNAAHPNAARLWANFMLSREAQDIIYDSDGMDSHLVGGSKTAPFVQHYEQGGVKLTKMNLDFYEQNNMAELNKTKQDVLRILTKK